LKWLPSSHHTNAGKVTIAKRLTGWRTTFAFNPKDLAAMP
ncbi:hypothetical protein NMY220_1328, partial [Neisseria meningitidis NM220]